MRYKFQKYNVYLEKKKYIVLIPYGVENNIWENCWSDWWYSTYLDASFKGIGILDACFALLGYDPHLILYLPIKNTQIPQALTWNPDNGKYDAVFMSEQSRVKGSTWVEIRQKLKKMKPTLYTFHYDYERNKVYFEKRLRKYRNIPDRAVVNKARGDNWLYADTAFFIYPIMLYQKNSILFHKYFYIDLTEADLANCYNEKDDSWTCYTFFVFSYGLRDKAKFTENRPGLTLNIELYDIDIVNRYRKDKDILVDPKQVDHSTYFRNDHYIKIIF